MIKPYMEYLTAIKNVRIYVYLCDDIPKDFIISFLSFFTF